MTDDVYGRDSRTRGFTRLPTTSEGLGRRAQKTRRTVPGFMPSSGCEYLPSDVRWASVYPRQFGDVVGRPPIPAPVRAAQPQAPRVIHPEVASRPGWVSDVRRLDPSSRGL